jgi:hypothetical protein
MGMAKKRSANSLDRPARHLAAVSDEDMESYQLPSHQVEVPVMLVQDSIASIVSVDLEPILESVL